MSATTALGRRVLASRILALADSYKVYVEALRETPAPDVASHRLAVEKYARIANDLETAAEMLVARG